MEKQDLGKTSTGIQPNVAALLSYLVGWVTGIIFFLLEKDNRYVRFHALQSIVTFGGLWVLSMALLFIPVAGWMAIALVQPLAFILWIVLMIKAYQGERFKLPVAGDVAEKNA
jgi:uncharacterized membrane protein